MSENRLPDYLDHMQQPATDACSFVEVLSKTTFSPLPGLLKQLPAVRRAADQLS